MIRFEIWKKDIEFRLEKYFIILTSVIFTKLTL